MITPEYARTRLHYDGATGNLIWRDYNRPGLVAGSIKRHGYRTVRLNGRYYQAHRLVWLIVHGCFPVLHLDHINGNRSDNRLKNLRLATVSQNAANRMALSKCGLKGVTRLKYGRWQAQFSRKYLGTFDTPEEANAAYFAAAQQKFGAFARAS